MIGLLKNQFYGAMGSGILFFVAFMAGGLVLLIIGNPALLNILVMVSAPVFVFSAIAGFRKEAATKWSRYELTAPITRNDIVKSRYIGHLFWATVGTSLAAIFVGLAVLLHGNRYFYHPVRDPLTLFCLSVGIALLFGALYYPAIYFFGADKSEMMIILSLFGAVGTALGIIWLINAGNNFEPLSDPEYYMFMTVFMGSIVLLFALSYCLTVFVFRKKEY